MSGARLVWSRLGDPRLVSWSTFLITTVIFLLDGAINVRGQGVSGTAVFTGVIVAQVMCFALLLLARLSRIMRGRPAIALITLVIASLVGVITGGIVQTSIAPDGLIQIEAAFYRAVVIAVVGVAVVSWRTYGESMQALRMTRDQLVRTRSDGARAFVAEREQVIDRVTEMVDESMGSIDMDQMDASARQLQYTAQEIIRPLSHELASTVPDFSAADVEPGAVRWRQLFDEVSLTPLVSPTFMAVAVTIFAARLTVDEVPEEFVEDREGLGVVVDAGSFLTSVTFLGVLFAAVWITSFLVRRVSAPLLPNRSELQRLGITAIGLLAIMVASGVVVAMFREGFGVSGIAQGMIVTVPVVAVAVVLAAFRLVLARLSLNEQALQAVNDELGWEVARIREALWQQRRAMARAVHGPLQAAVTAGGLQLRTAADPEPVIKQLQANIANALQEIRGDGAPIAVSEQFVALQQTWAGVCAVHLDMADTALAHVQADRMTATAAVEIVQEAVANAARHGSAQNTWVSLSCPSDRQLQVVVRDDGSPRPGEPVPGLGSAILDEVCLTWDLDRGPEGSTLQAALPLAPAGRHDWHST